MPDHPAAGAAPIRVLVAEDHGLMLEAILNRLQSDPEVEVVGAVADGRALVEAYARMLAAGTAPDLVLCDHGMPRLNGTQATEQIIALDPDAKVLILSAYEDDSLVVAAMAAGAVGYLLKSVPPSELREKARAAARGEPVFDSRTASAIVGAVRRKQRPVGTAAGSTPLSQREVEVLSLVSEGLSNAEVGEKLFISGQTVKTHLERIYSKLGVSGRTAAVKKGIETGAIRSD
ncbi:MAG: response regulator [Acidimicrobiia bacterium]